MIFLVCTAKKSHVLLKIFSEKDLMYAQICRDRFEHKALRGFSHESFYLIRALSRDHLWEVANYIMD